jgi:plasmid stability protein
VNIIVIVARLIVRNIDEELVRKLKVRAAQHGRSAEEEHRQILRRALEAASPAMSFKELLSQMPDRGEDHDLDRDDDLGRDVEL